MGASGTKEMIVKDVQLMEIISTADKEPLMKHVVGVVVEIQARQRLLLLLQLHQHLLLLLQLHQHRLLLHLQRQLFLQLHLDVMVLENVNVTELTGARGKGGRIFVQKRCQLQNVNHTMGKSASARTRDANSTRLQRNARVDGIDLYVYSMLIGVNMAYAAAKYL